MFDSLQTAGVDCHCENQVSSKESVEDNEEDSDYEPELDSKSESKDSCVEDYNDEDSPPALQELSVKSISHSVDGLDNSRFDYVPKLQSKKHLSMFLEELGSFQDSSSESREEIDREWQLESKNRVTKVQDPRRIDRFASQAY